MKKTNHTYYIEQIFNFRMTPDQVNTFFNKLLKDVIVYRQDHNVQRNDLVQYLIEVKRKTIEVEKGNIKSDIVTKSKELCLIRYI